MDLAVSFLYVVALGLDITTQANLAADPVQHTPRRLTPEHCVRHIPAISGSFFGGFSGFFGVFLSVAHHRDHLIDCTSYVAPHRLHLIGCNP